MGDDVTDVSRKSSPARWSLRGATSDAHQRLDAGIDRLSLSTGRDYRIFLRMSHPGSASVEMALTSFGIVQTILDWAERIRTSSLEEDLAGLGQPVAQPLSNLSFDNLPQVLGAAYVLEGSRLGARILLARAMESDDPAIHDNTRYLRHGAGRPLWSTFVEVLEDQVKTEADRDQARLGALKTFDAFQRAIDLETPNTRRDEGEAA